MKIPKQRFLFFSRHCLILFALFFLISQIARAYPRDFDVVVYGGTSGGVTAAVQAARMGKSVVLLTPTKHLGGLTTSGLGFTDLGDSEILGGLSRDFYHEVYLHYQDDASWDQQSKANFGNSGQGGPAFDSTLEIASVFEPKIAEGVFDRWISEAGILKIEARLDLNNGVVMTGQRITALRMEDGRFYRAKMFIDASYEGDVMAGAGVSFTVGREANATYGETINGIQVGRSGGNQLYSAISPYVVEGDPNSGLLPGVNSDAGGADGSADQKLQAFCYRMCLTNKAENRVTIEQPQGYDEADYEIVFRSIEAGQLNNFIKLSAMPNRKTDSNNTGGISTDFIGKNYGDGWDWTTLNHGQRDALAKEHENWQRGLIWTLQNHPRVKAVIPAGLYGGWGLPAVEFTDNGNWPHQLYVREARRMVADYVMTQKNCAGNTVAPESVGMAAYTMDSHHTQRIVSGGQLKNEGDVQTGTAGAYPVSYRAIIPKVGECENLLVPWCLSATHMAFGSIRMEPVFMSLGQSSGTAAAMAIDEATSVQNLPYALLETKLRADGVAIGKRSGEIGSDGIIIDNKDSEATITGAWTSSASVSGYYFADYIADGNTGQGTKSVTYAPAFPSDGRYTVFLRWTSHQNRATNVPVKILHAGGVSQTTVNQKQNGGVWNSLGEFDFTPGNAGALVIETTGANGFVVADAALWVPVGIASEEVGILTTVPSAERGSSHPAEIVFSRGGIATSTLTVNYQISGTVLAGDFSPALSGQVLFPIGISHVALELFPIKGARPLGLKNLVVTLQSDAAYRLSSSSVASIEVRDSSFDAWRFAHFSATQLGNPAVSGETADPDGDGLGNLLEFLSGGLPEKSDANGPKLRVGENGVTYLDFPRKQEAMALKFKVMESEDLDNWTESPSDAISWPRRLENGMQMLSVPLFQGALKKPKMFYRLRIDR